MAQFALVIPAQNGAHCPHSCEAQAWSVGCMLEAVQDLRRLTDEEQKK